VPLTKVGSTQNAGDGARAEIWRLVGPATGVHDVVVTLSGSNEATVGVMTLTAVDQTTPLGAYASGSGDDTSGSATANSATGELVFDVIAVKDVDQPLAPGAGQTERWDLFTGSNANGGGSTAPGASAVVMSWSWVQGTDWAIGAVPIRPIPSGITVLPTSGLTTTEAGGTATFTVVLDTQPTADVTVGLTSSDLSEGTVVPDSVVYTPADWSTAQVVTVTGVDDAAVDGDIVYTIVTAAATSADGSYGGLNASDVSVTNTDDDVAAPLTIVKRAFLIDGTPIASGISLPKGTLVRFLLYVNNPGGAVTDVTVQDVLDPGFTYVPGSLRWDDSSSSCPAGCGGAEEASLYAAIAGGTSGTDATDGDPVAFAGGGVHAGDGSVGSARLDVPAGKVWGVLFTTRVE
jgi:uncharacterized repeat protein (TIGR01451 family)